MRSIEKPFTVARALILATSAVVLLGGAVWIPRPESPEFRDVLLTSLRRAKQGGAQARQRSIATVQVRSTGNAGQAFTVVPIDSASVGITSDAESLGSTPLQLVTPATFTADLTGGEVQIVSLSGKPLEVSADFTDSPALKAEMKYRAVILTRGGAGVRAMESHGPPFFEHQVSIAAVQIPGVGAPVYPAALRASGVEGQVIAQFVVDEEGIPQPQTFKVIRSTNAFFSAAVADALPRMRFTPAKKDRVFVKQLIQQAFVFKLDKQR